jgi:hypothetical protein
VTHEQLLAEVLDLAQAHAVPYIVANGSRSTPGAVDLVLVGRDNLACVEVKSEDGRRTRPQIAFANRVDNCYSPARYHLWRPSDLEAGKVEDVLADLATHRC